MNERYGEDPYGQRPPQQPEILGYDEFGQPIYRQEPEHGYPGYQPNPSSAPYNPYGGAREPGPYGPTSYDPNSYGSYGTYGTQPQPGYGQQLSQQPPTQQQTYQEQPYEPPQQQEWIPQQQSRPPQQPVGEQQVPQQRQGGGGGAPRDEGEYRTDQFSFVEEPADESEDVIDWLKFTESRTERREEAKRRGRHRITALVVVLVLAAACGAGYLWYAGKLPGVGGKGGAAAAPQGQQRDVIAVHLRPTGSKSSSTALLVDNAAGRKGNTVLLPNTLAVSAEGGGSTTLAKSVVSGGAAPTRESLGTLLGADIKGTWRLDTPFLENLVELVGGINVDADTAVPAEKKGDPPQVQRGAGQELDGRAAVAYATYRAPGEQQAAQLNRFGQVMQATLGKLSSDPETATHTVQSLGQIPDPSLSESELGASLAKLAERAKSGAYRTELLPVQPNGTLSRSTGEGLVKRVLGGTVKNTGTGSAPRVEVTSASGDRGAANAASAALANGGYTVVDGHASGGSSGASRVTYGKPAQKAKAVEVAKTLGLPGSAVRQGRPGSNADVGVLLGRDYRG